jgi:hypothetical protein
VQHCCTSQASFTRPGGSLCVACHPAQEIRRTAEQQSNSTAQHSRAAQQHSSTAAQQSSRAAKQHSSTAEQQSSSTTAQQSSKTEQQHSRAAEQQHNSTTAQQHSTTPMVRIALLSLVAVLASWAPGCALSRVELLPAPLRRSSLQMAIGGGGASGDLASTEAAPSAPSAPSALISEQKQEQAQEQEQAAPSATFATSEARTLELQKRANRNKRRNEMPLSQAWYKARQAHISPNQKRALTSLWPVYGVDLKFNVSGEGIDKYVSHVSHITIIDTIIHHILTNYTNDAYYKTGESRSAQPISLHPLVRAFNIHRFGYRFWEWRVCVWVSGALPSQTVYR